MQWYIQREWHTSELEGIKELISYLPTQEHNKAYKVNVKGKEYNEKPYPQIQIGCQLGLRNEK